MKFSYELQGAKTACTSLRLGPGAARKAHPPLVTQVCGVHVPIWKGLGPGVTALFFVRLLRSIDKRDVFR